MLTITHHLPTTNYQPRAYQPPTTNHAPNQSLNIFPCTFPITKNAYN
ncbi:MAG: hypothetical protein ACHBN1_19490 [Heteroscytonema crispum UTEX LB 1556]